MVRTSNLGRGGLMSKFLYLLILRPANGGYQYLKHTSFKASLHQVTYSGKVTQKQYN